LARANDTARSLFESPAEKVALMVEMAGAGESLSPEAHALLAADHARGEHRDVFVPVCPDCAAGVESDEELKLIVELA
jgi:hypothetical protein